MKIDLLQGTLDMLILKALTWGSMHGYAITHWLEQATEEALRVEEGSLYPALHRLEERGWVEAVWGTTDSNRKARFYTLTEAGREHLGTASPRWLRFAQAVGQVLLAREQPAG